MKADTASPGGGLSKLKSMVMVEYSPDVIIGNVSMTKGELSSWRISAVVSPGERRGLQSLFAQDTLHMYTF